MMYEQAIQAIIDFADKKHNGNLSAAAEALGVKVDAFRRWYLKDRVPNGESLGIMLDKLGMRLLPPSAPEPREVCFVDAKIVQAGNGAPPPDSEDYLAVPLVGEAGAGPGIIPQDIIESWVLVYRKHRSVQRRSNLLAVEIGRGQTSMIPTLHPEDVVLVDRDDCGQQTGYTPPGNIYLVREPGQEGGGMVKRVTLTGKGDMETIIFYSDNKEYAPEPYLMSLYDHDLHQAIVGKVVWAWADLSRK
jgi:hypothetical protein